jgi:hypothetical protein
MKKIYSFIPLGGLFFSLLIIGCGSGSSTPAIGSDIITHYNFHVESEPTTTTFLLPQQFNDANWGLKENLCEQAGYSLIPFAGQSVSLVRYDLVEKYFGPAVPVGAGEPLYLWIVAKDQLSICGYLSVRENSSLIPGVFALNDPSIR